jgi:hypothetical protein
MATALTYRTSDRKGDLRTVVVKDVRQSVVLLPTGSFDVLTAKLLEGTSSRHSFWAEALGTNPGDHLFICPTSQVVTQRPITVATVVRRRK